MMKYIAPAVVVMAMTAAPVQAHLTGTCHAHGTIHCLNEQAQGDESYPPHEIDETPKDEHGRPVVVDKESMHLAGSPWRGAQGRFRNT